MEEYKTALDGVCYWFEPKVIKGKLYLKNTATNDFECAAFMANERIEDGQFFLEPNMQKHLIIKSTPIGENHGELLQNKIIEWWLGIVNDALDIKTEYLGMEDGRQYFKYPLPYTDKPGYNLYRFTAFRYVWAHPYISLIKRMFNVSQDIIDKFGFWNVFMLLHYQLSNSIYYDNTFGFTYGQSYIVLNSKFQDNLLTEIACHLNSEYGAYRSINDTFGEEYNNKRISSSFEEIDKYLSDAEIIEQLSIKK